MVVELYVRFLDALSLKAVRTLLCQRLFFEVDGCDPQRLVPLSELLERAKMVCGGVAQSKACLVSGLVVV